MEADHLRVVVGDLKTQMLDIEERSLPWIRRLNQNVCSKVVCHVRPLMIESSPCGCSIHLAKEERLTRIVAGSDDGANHPQRASRSAKLLIRRNPHSILGLRSPVQILTPIPEVARTKHKAQDFPSLHPEQTTLAS